MSTCSYQPPSVSATRVQPGDVPLHSSVFDVLIEPLVLGEVNLQNDGLLCHSYQILLVWLTDEPAGQLRGGWDSDLQEDLEASPSIHGILPALILEEQQNSAGIDLSVFLLRFTQVVDL
jgi:hypothetical protein